MCGDTVADLGEGSRGSVRPYFGVNKKKSQKEEKPVGKQ